ncbi:deleted in malignant brain tumors 1 protein-like isoform X2 [Boleophthalmus pectinirostris]|uniref:deleted in malignant brain tumors 1 protein-like isoform X2 n=1 Tax=Boleophthalmus pectinirostris TaxID=150288 RepID=UPI00242E7728|nr:deleted in malignant brain tumors 1 protein-like isoform X2 [Boleophthalmus pectinirostris]
MIFPSSEKSIFYWFIGFLSLPLVAECNKIRLVGPSRCSGRVEVFHQDSWGTVCDDNWGLSNAEVVCREVSCGTVVEAKTVAFFGQGKDQIWLDDVHCTGHELSLMKCRHRPFGENNCGHGEDAGVICSENLRLLNGSDSCRGRVELYRNGHWKRVCSTQWGEKEASIICQELHCGLPDLSQTGKLLFGAAAREGGVKTSCAGNETSFSKCGHEELREVCVDATVVCSNNKPIRVVNGTTRCSGRVEIYHAGQWGTICDDHWGMHEANVACRQLNCGNAVAVKYKAFYGMGTDQVWMDDIDCTGRENALAECPHRGFGDSDCDHNEDAGLVCSESVRLINGTDRCSGRLEVFHNGQWSKICNTNWGMDQAKIVCREIECGAPQQLHETLNFGDSGAQRGYTASCSGSVDSISQCRIQENRGSCDGVFLSCADVQPLRLVNGTDRCSGRVEMLHDGQWGTVCDDMWDIHEAEVVCRAMDCGSAQTVKTSAFFGQGHGNIWLDDMNCLGNESSLLHCQHPSFGENNCGHGEDAGVICSANIRLNNGTDLCSGRVEIYHNEMWSAAVNVNWGMTEATVICREMSCGDAVSVSESGSHNGLLGGVKVSCSGRESIITQCSLQQYTRTGSGHLGQASVVCSGDVKLLDGPNRCAGRVEVYNKGQWGSVCGESWDLNDASVVCQQLKCGNEHSISTSSNYGPGSGRVWVDQIECSGRETAISQCPQRPFVDRTCNITSLAGVVCSDSLNVRLAEGSDSCSGRVEVLSGEVWATVCDADWTLEKAEVVCEIIECGNAISAPGGAHFNPGTGLVIDSSNTCFTNRATLQHCAKNGFKTSTCAHERDAGVVCAATIRLVGGSNSCSGRVEVLHKGQWGTVCDDDWSLSNAKVVCQQLGCGQELSAPTSAHFGRGEGPIWLDNVECTGEEVALSQCKHPNYGINNCGHSEDASVICFGALSKPQLTLSTGPEVNWGDRVEFTCTVMTEQLGGTFVLSNSQGSLKMERFSEGEAAVFVFPKVNFTQKGSYFCEFKKKVQSQVFSFPQSNVVDLSVKMKLEKPSITLTSPHAMLIYSPDKLTVKKGDSFFITCSVHSTYPGGYFYLTKSNTSRSEPKAAFGHSIFYMANFEFPSIQYEHQGLYSCIYALNISSQSFCSDASKTIQVTVVDGSSSSTVSGIIAGVVVLVIVLVIGYMLWRRRRWGAGTMVTFSNRLDGAIQQNMDERKNRPLDDRVHGAQTRHEFSRVLEDKSEDVNLDNTVEGVHEDLAGRVCYELEPLVTP